MASYSNAKIQPLAGRFESDSRDVSRLCFGILIIRRFYSDVSFLPLKLFFFISLFHCLYSLENKCLLRDGFCRHQSSGFNGVENSDRYLKLFLPISGSFEK